MKTFLLALTLLLSIPSFSQTGNSSELADAGFKKFPIEKGKVDYQVSGNATGKATLYFDRFGWRSVLVTELTIKQFGVESKEHAVEIWDGDSYTRVDRIAQKGTRKKDDRWSQLARYKEAAEIPGIFYTNDGGVSAGTERILDRETTKWTFTKGIVQSVNDWGGLPLKTSKKLPGLLYEVEAIAIIEGASLDESLLVLSENIQWE